MKGIILYKKDSSGAHKTSYIRTAYRNLFMFANKRLYVNVVSLMGDCDGGGE